MPRDMGRVVPSIIPEKMLSDSPPMAIPGRWFHVADGVEKVNMAGPRWEEVYQVTCQSEEEPGFFFNRPRQTLPP